MSDYITKKFSALLSKADPVEADSLIGIDSQDGNKLKKFSLPRILRYVLGDRSIGEESTGETPEDSIVTTNSTQQVREKTFKTSCAYESSSLGTMPLINGSGVHLSGADNKLKKMALYLFRRLIGAGNYHYAEILKEMESGDAFTVDSDAIMASLSIQGTLLYSSVNVNAFAVLDGEDDNPTLLEKIACTVVITRTSNDAFSLEITPDISVPTSVLFNVSVMATD